MEIYVVSGCYQDEYGQVRLTNVEIFKTKDEAHKYIEDEWDDAQDMELLSDEMDSELDEDGAVMYYNDDTMCVYEIFEKEV